MFRFVMGIVAASALAGCAEVETGAYKDKRFAVKGNVTLDGRPLEGGTIAFIATAEGQRQSGGPIVAGKYDVPEGRGPNAGKYRVEIRWSKPTGKQVKDTDLGGMIDVVAEGVPNRYNDKSILTATIGDQVEWDFDMVSK